MLDVSTAQRRRVTRSEAARGVGKTGGVWRADGRAADGLGGKPGRGLPFLDGSKVVIKKLKLKVGEGVFHQNNQKK